MALSFEQYPCKFDYQDRAIKDILTKRIERQRKKILGVSINNGDQIPEHLIIEILSWLPVQTLLKFKSVCKLWYDVIKSSYFISKHLRNYYDDNNWRDCLIVQYEKTNQREVNMYELLIDDKKNRALSHQRIKTPVDNSFLCGPCDGIYLLWRYYYSIGPKHSLWNPALNEFKILPDITLKETRLPHSRNIRERCYGFGYDSMTDDYKVILILNYNKTPDDDSTIANNRMSIIIYSLRTNSWRYWGDIDNSYGLEWSKSYDFVNGCYYWLAYRELNNVKNYEMIVSFDISGDTYQEIRLPEFESRPRFWSQLIVYQDSIAFVYVPKDNTSFSIWTWNNEVWTEKLKLKLNFKVWGAFNQWRDNMLVFREARSKLVLLDPNTKELFVLDDPRAGRCQNICAYKESLVSINDFGKEISVREEKPDIFPSIC